MTKRKRGGISGKKSGSVIDDAINSPQKSKPKKQKKKKSSKGK